jgi:hypothetical protein
MTFESRYFFKLVSGTHVKLPKKIKTNQYLTTARSRIFVKAGYMNSTAIIGLAEGWDRIERFGIQKLIRMIESEDAKVQFTNAEYMALYT